MDILERLTSLADQAEVVELGRESTKVVFQANRLKSSGVQETQGVAVRVVKDGRIGFAASSDMTATERLIGNVMESAAYGEQVPLAFPGPQAGAAVQTFDPTIADLPIDRLVEMGREIIDLLLAAEPGILVDVTLERGVQHTSLCNHVGTQIEFKRSPLSMMVEVNRIQGDDILIMFDLIGVTMWEADYLAAARRLATKLEMARRMATVKSGRMPVLFSPTGSLVLGLPLMYGLDGKNVYTGISPMRGKIGEKLFDDKISVLDDATLDGRLDSAPFDDEGVAHRRNTLVENGVLKSFVYDLKTAAQSGVESTGNGSRGLFNSPSPSLTNLIIQPGQASLADMIAGIEEGLLVEDVLGLGQGNIISGAFSNPLSLAFKIEKGEIVGRVKNASIAGNIYELLRDVAAVSGETRWVYGSLNLPYILLPDMNVVAQS